MLASRVIVSRPLASRAVLVRSAVCSHDARSGVRASRRSFASVSDEVSAAAMKGAIKGAAREVTGRAKSGVANMADAAREAVSSLGASVQQQVKHAERTAERADYAIDEAADRTSASLQRGAQAAAKAGSTLVETARAGMRELNAAAKEKFADMKAELRQAAPEGVNAKLSEMASRVSDIAGVAASNAREAADGVRTAAKETAREAKSHTADAVAGAKLGVTQPMMDRSRGSSVQQSGSPYGSQKRQFGSEARPTDEKLKAMEDSYEHEDAASSLPPTKPEPLGRGRRMDMSNGEEEGVQEATSNGAPRLDLTPRATAQNGQESRRMGQQQAHAPANSNKGPR